MTNKTGNTRARMLLPAAVIFVLYAVFLGAPRMRSTYATQAKADKLAANAERDGTNQARAFELKTLNTRIAQEQADQSALQRRLVEMAWSDRGAGAQAALTEPVAQGLAGTDVVHRLALLLEAHHLTVVSEGPAELDEHIALPVYLSPPGSMQAPATAAHRYNSDRSYRRPAKETAARPWRVVFVGSYGDVVRTMQALDGLGLHAVPIGLSMDDYTPDPTLHTWTLLIWI